MVETIKSESGTGGSGKLMRGGLCWVRLPQGTCLENSLFPLKVGSRWVVVNGLRMGSESGCPRKSGFWGAKVGAEGSSVVPIFHFGPISLIFFSLFWGLPCFFPFRGIPLKAFLGVLPLFFSGI